MQSVNKIQKSRAFTKYVFKKTNAKSLRDVSRLLSRLNTLCEEISKDFSNEDDVYLKGFIIIYLTKLLSQAKKNVDLKAFENLATKSIAIISSEAQSIVKNERSGSETTKDSPKQ